MGKVRSIADGRRIARVALCALTATVLVGCHTDMYDQPRSEALEKSDFFADQRASRPAVVGAIARGNLQEDEVFYTGKVAGQIAEEPPITIDLEVLKRGQERFNIFCTPCHGRAGEGDGMIVERGFRRPPTFHSDRMRGVAIGHFFDVMTNGFATMPDYARQISPRDRWAIAVYIRALQLSQHAKPDDLSEADRRSLDTKDP